MRTRLILCFVLMCGLASVRGAAAQTAAVPAERLFGATFLIPDQPAGPLSAAASPTRLRLMPLDVTSAPDQQPPQVAFVYSDGYQTRAKIHRIASYATLPLFGLEAWVGSSLYNNPTDGKKSAHLAIATAMGALFGINSVTGVWNLVEQRKDPKHRTLPMIHGLMMLAADGAFLATAMTGPHEHRDDGRPGRAITQNQNTSSRNLHRSLAFTSIGLASVSYTIMLFGK